MSIKPASPALVNKNALTELKQGGYTIFTQ